MDTPEDTKDLVIKTVLLEESVLLDFCFFFFFLLILSSCRGQGGVKLLEGPVEFC